MIIWYHVLACSIIVLLILSVFPLIFFVLATNLFVVRFLILILLIFGAGFDIFAEFNDDGACSANKGFKVSWCG